MASFEDQGGRVVTLILTDVDTDEEDYSYWLQDTFNRMSHNLIGLVWSEIYTT